mmetsp:Transcript_18491/g.33050  ORF Transcript_18491/g.33050 Transcript_18491/m.33050 type:complete len:267 (-) Transcript_18491:642-1442(-)
MDAQPRDSKHFVFHSQPFLQSTSAIVNQPRITIPSQNTRRLLRQYIPRDSHSALFQVSVALLVHRALVEPNRLCVVLRSAADYAGHAAPQRCAEAHGTRLAGGEEFELSLSSSHGSAHVCSRCRSIISSSSIFALLLLLRRLWCILLVKQSIIMLAPVPPTILQTESETPNLPLRQLYRHRLAVQRRISQWHHPIHSHADQGAASVLVSFEDGRAEGSAGPFRDIAVGKVDGEGHHFVIGVVLTGEVVGGCGDGPRREGHHDALIL